MITLVGRALAYESDQLTDRDVPLPDATPWADALFEELLAEAIAETNRGTRCEGGDDEVRRRLAREIREATSRPALYAERGFPASLGFDRYSVVLERSSAPKRSFDGRDDVFGDLHPWQAFVLATAGVCSTFRLGDTLVGTDKIEHFLATGEDWFRWSRHGADVERALRKGTRRERTWEGSATSRVFSFADLRANADGMAFYAGLLGEGSALRRGPDGCVMQVRPWSWTEWVDPMWDEVLDPPVFRDGVRRGVERRIEEQRERYCRAWDALSAEARSALTDPPPRVPWAAATAPARAPDPFGLARACDAPDAQVSARP